MSLGIGVHVIGNWKVTNHWLGSFEARVSCQCKVISVIAENRKYGTWTYNLSVLHPVTRVSRTWTRCSSLIAIHSRWTIAAHTMWSLEVLHSRGDADLQMSASLLRSSFRNQRVRNLMECLFQELRALDYMALRDICIPMKLTVRLCSFLIFVDLKHWFCI